MLNVSALIARMQDQVTSDQVFLGQCLEDYSEVVDICDDVADSLCPIFDKVLADSGEDGVRVLTNFTRREFDVLWEIVELPLKARWHDGRGSKSKTSPRDGLFMTLAVLKHYNSWEKQAMDFGFRAPTFQKLVQRVIDVVVPVFVAEFVKMPSMSELRANNGYFNL
ncbi:hypothetical protein DYB38_013301 [Aphanomyces astaci]|uniref:DDE Tnp4 domain-containing protein n=1 Tax=Aphanomyces astaci TaxID=112090 RepID=A0A397DXF5_APHAT|nr:hypothetical protein DYB38_013301 [Aphanomyces astaci]